MKKFRILLVGLMVFSPMVAHAQDTASIAQKSEELIECLWQEWNLDYYTACYMALKFGSLLQDPTNHAIIDDFIAKSKGLNLYFPDDKELTPLCYEDGMVQAPHQHMVIFESPWIRVLWGSLQPGEEEKLHTHAWKSIMVIVEPTTYEIKYENGTVETAYWPRGVYLLGIEAPYSCTNVGHTADVCLRFEIKE